MHIGASRQTARQLNLFKGKRQRGITPPPPMEFLTQCAVADTLRLSCVPGWWWTALPFGEFRPLPTAKRLQRMGVRGGLPDFLFLHEAGQTAWLELKRGKLGKLSDDQEAVFPILEGRGDRLMVALNFKDAVAMLQDAGILPKTIKVQ